MKNSFRLPALVDETILDEHGKTIATVRLKPTGVLWKPKNAQMFHMVTLKQFTDWIVHPDTKARKTKK